MVILLLRCFIFNSIFEDLDDQISKIKKTFFHSPTTATIHFSRDEHENNGSTLACFLSILMTHTQTRKEYKIDEWWTSLTNIDLKQI